MPIQGTIHQPLKLDSFFKQYPLITYERGERVIRPRELTANVIFIKSGFLKIYHVSKSGREIIINIINAASYPCLLFGTATYIKRYSVEALTKVTVYSAPRNVFLEYIKNNAETYNELMLPLSRCLESMYCQAEWLKSGDASFKIAAVINYLGKETGHTDKNSITIGFRLTHQMIANFTGLTRETVTVQLNKLRDQGFIDYEDNILTITNIEKLTHLIDNDG